VARAAPDLSDSELLGRDSPSLQEDLRGAALAGGSLRRLAARGVVINTAFEIGLSMLLLLQGFIVAALLSRSAYGVWGILVVSIGVLASLKAVGIADKYIQQEEPDQELAFQKAFTLDLLVTGITIVAIAAALPAVAVVYGQWKLVAPGAVLITVLAADALQAPLWIYYRRMRFARQRALTAIAPVVSFVVTIVLAILGAGYWAMAVGVALGAWATAIAALVSSPFPLRWRYDKGALRTYTSFSWPILIVTGCAVVLANGSMIAANAHLGLAAAGALALAASITAFTTRVDDLVGMTLYPAICAIQHRLDLLRESFVKSNRLALIWAMPFGAGLSLFASDLVRFGIGDKWEPAVGLLEITGVVAAISHICFNWDDYFRARADTRPLAVAAVASTATMLGVGIPLLLAHGLTGLGIGIGAGAAVHLLIRAWYVSRLFEGFVFVSHALRAVLPTIPGVLAVLAMRSLETGHRSAGIAGAELAVYVVVTAIATWLVEGPLVREALGYLKPPATAPGIAPR
jgi:O-antigen/teichoic acid export membrane protein